VCGVCVCMFDAESCNVVTVKRQSEMQTNVKLENYHYFKNVE